MEIVKDKVVSIIYQLRKDTVDGEVVETVGAENPLTFLFGAGGMLPKFEENLGGKKVGEAFKFGLTSVDAYGPVVDNAIVDVPLEVFKVDGQVDENMLKVGNMVPMMDNNGNRLNGKITEIMEETVKMDFNHPMAGKELFFEGEITEVREATAEELSHGHVHQNGGCADGSCNDGNCDDKEKSAGCGCGC